MGSLVGALRRLLVMGAVMAAVLATCVVAGVGNAIAVALAVVLAGLTGLVMVARRPKDSTVAADAPDASSSHVHGSPVQATPVESRRQPDATVDPESLMPRWRRPSLLEARRATPGRQEPPAYTPMRFHEAYAAQADLRTVRYAIVPVMDRPDEVAGNQVRELGSGDQVEVVGSEGMFLEVICPTGERGWVHRTTVTQPAPTYLAPALAEVPVEAEDALTALLAARGFR